MGDVLHCTIGLSAASPLSYVTPAAAIRGLSLHVPTRRVTVSTRHVDLTASEYALLETLMLRADRVITRRFLEERSFGNKREPQQCARCAYWKFAAKNWRRLCANGAMRPWSKVVNEISLRSPDALSPLKVLNGSGFSSRVPLTSCELPSRRCEST